MGRVGDGQVTILNEQPARDEFGFSGDLGDVITGCQDPEVLPALLKKFEGIWCVGWGDDDLEECAVIGDALGTCIVDLGGAGEDAAEGRHRISCDGTVDCVGIGRCRCCSAGVGVLEDDCGVLCALDFGHCSAGFECCRCVIEVVETQRFAVQLLCVEKCALGRSDGAIGCCGLMRIFAVAEIVDFAIAQREGAWGIGVVACHPLGDHRVVACGLEECLCSEIFA